jgi:hypothetical protein
MSNLLFRAAGPFEPFQTQVDETADVSLTLETIASCNYPSPQANLRNGIEEADGSIPFISTHVRPRITSLNPPPAPLLVGTQQDRGGYYLATRGSTARRRVDGACSISGLGSNRVANGTAGRASSRTTASCGGSEAPLAASWLCCSVGASAGLRGPRRAAHLRRPPPLAAALRRDG